MSWRTAYRVRKEALRARLAARDATDGGAGQHSDAGMTLVELLVAMTTLILLLTVVVTALTAYLSTSTTVISSYSATDQLLPSSVVIQRLVRAEVEPAPTAPATLSVPYPTPTPPFVPSSVTPSSMTFYANVGNPDGPAQITMALSSATTQCAGCVYPTAAFTVTETDPTPGTCPGVSTGTACSYTGQVARQLVSIPNVVETPTSGPVFTYTVLDCTNAVPVSGSDPQSVFDRTQYPVVSSCPTPSTTSQSIQTAYNSGDPTGTPACVGSVNLAESCPADAIQSVEIDLPVYVRGAPIQVNDFTVYRLSSYSYLYSATVG